MRYNHVVFGMLAFASIVVISAASYLFVAILRFDSDAQTIVREQQTLSLINNLLSVVKDAETGQRGYILTADETYLEPYYSSRRTLDELLRALPSEHFADGERLGDNLQALVSQKLALVDSSIHLRRKGDFSQAQSIVASNQGKLLMDTIRAVCKKMQQIEHQKITTAIAQNKSSVWNTKLTILIAAPTVLWILIGFAVVTNRLLRSRERTHQALLEQKRFTDAILDMMPSFVYVFDVQHQKFDYVNNFFELLLGYSSDELKDKGAELLWSCIHPDDVDTLRQHFAEVMTHGKDNSIYEIEYRIFHKDGTLHWFADRGMVFRRNNEGQATHILAFILDITMRVVVDKERQRSKMFLNSVINTSLYSIVALEAIRDENKNIIDFRYILVNNVAQKGFDRSVEEIQQSSVLNLYPGVIKTGQFAHYCEVVNSGMSNVFEVHYSGDGFDNWFINACSKLNDGLVIIYYDITERKAAEQMVVSLNAELAQKNVELESLVEQRTAQLRNANDELSHTNTLLEETNKELEAFSYSVSHDLRAPLRSVNGFAEVLREQYTSVLDEEGVRMLGRITNGAEKMSVLIDDLLSLSRLGRKTMQFSEVDMEALVRSVLSALNAHNELADYTIEIGDLPRIVCDAGLMRQVWENLISNAVKYSRNSVKKVISISAVSKQDRVEYAVRDTGVGFDMRYAGKLFNVFQRLHKERDFEGTGVGLAIVKRIVTKHGGKVYAEAEVNKGATFLISLPNNILPTISTFIEESNYERS